MATPKFSRKVENFTCQNCKTKVFGNGYTNHCPNCLWSKHVDVNPGDRQASCGGLMKPEAASYKSGKWSIVHRCQNCGHQKNNKLGKDDNLEQLEKLNNDNF